MKRRMLVLLVAAILLFCAAFHAAATEAENPTAAEGKRIQTEALQIVFPTDGTAFDGNCPVHGAVTWLPLTAETIGTGFTAENADTHYYLAGSVEAAGAKFAMADGDYTSCLHLNGKNLINTSGVAVEGAAGVLNVMGSGTVKGAGAADDYSSAATVLMSNTGAVNLYGGTYEKYAPAAEGTNTLGVGNNGGTVALYTGATVNAGTSGSAVYLDSSMELANATLNIYGGTVDGSASTDAPAVNTKAVGDSNTKVMTINLYAGEIVGGTRTYGGSIPLQKHVTLNMYGGTIRDGVATTSGGNVYVATGAVFNMRGGTIQDGTAATNGGNVYVGTSAIFYMHDGLITKGTSNGTSTKNGNGGGNVYLYKSTMYMYDGEISSGKAKLSGGCVCVGESASFYMYDGLITLGQANLGSTNYLTGGGNVFAYTSAKFYMYDGTISYGKANRGGNVGATKKATLEITGGIIEYGEAKVDGGNLWANAGAEEASDRVNINLSNVIIRNGTTTSASSYGGNISIFRSNMTIGEGTLISDGESGYRAGNLRLFRGTIVMTGGKISGGTAADPGYDEIQLESDIATYKSVMYMLGGVVESKEAEGKSFHVNGNAQLYLGGDATITDKNSGNFELFMYSSGKLFACDGWTGSATVCFNTPGTPGATMDTSKLQVVTLDADRNATAGGSFTGRLKDFTNGAFLIATGATDGAVTVGQMAVVDAAGKVTVTDDPLTLWATGEYAFIRLYKPFEISDPAQGLWVDLNGCTLTLNGSGSIHVFDSGNDGYKAAACGQVINNGTVTFGDDVVAPNGNRYLALMDGKTATMHRVSLKLTSVTLRTTQAGIYYKAKYECDEVLSAKVKRYGVVVSLVDMPGADFLTEWDDNSYTSTKAAFQSGATATSGSVFNIMKTSITDAAENAARGEMVIYSNPYICFDMGKDKIVVADNTNPGKTKASEGFDGAGYSLHDVMDMLDDTYYSYPAATRNAISQFYKTWQEKGMGQWDFGNVGELVDVVDNGELKFTSGTTQATCSVCKKTVTWIPFSQANDTTAKIGVAAAGAHYYLTEDVTYTVNSTATGFISNPTAMGSTACLHLNGHSLTATGAAAIYAPWDQMGILNVMGSGTVCGNRNGTGVTVYMSSQSADGRVNLYGGTYIKPAANTATLAAIANGGSIHVYEGAWLKGNGNGNAAYIDTAANAAATIGVHGGKITGGELATGANAGKNDRTVVIDGNSYVEQVTIRNEDTKVEVAGAPVADYIALVSGAKLTVGTMRKGAKIGVSAPNGVFTNVCENANAYLGYFYAWNAPDSIGVTDAGELSYDINYEYYMTPYVRDVKAEAMADGKIHYYFMAAKGMIMSPTNAGDTDKWGDSCLVVFPNGKTMLIDSGYAVQAPVIIGNLKRMGIGTEENPLDYLLITHPHNDHIGGAFGSSSTFLDEIIVKQVYYQDLQYNSSWDGVLESKCEARSIPYTPLWKGDVLTIGEDDLAVTLTMLWPGEDADLTIDSAANNNSMVFRFDYGKHSSLFTADVYSYTDEKLLEMYPNGELDVDMMKVPHHGLGTNTSSVKLLAAVTPEIAVCTGSFDLSSTIITRYADIGATLLEDRLHGYIHIASGTDGVMTTETE